MLDLDGWVPVTAYADRHFPAEMEIGRIDMGSIYEAPPFDLDRECAAAREHLRRSIGQRARWAMVAIRARVERERVAMMPRSLIESQKNDFTRGLMMNAARLSVDYFPCSDESQAGIKFMTTAAPDWSLK